MINVMIADDQELICQSLEIVIKSKSDMKVGSGAKIKLI